jgi:putative selenate reductase FAD-binding subunit
MVDHFHAPRTVREALRLKKKFPMKSAYLAGGTFLNSKDYSLRPVHLISLEGLGGDAGMASVEVRAGQVRIGSLCTIQQLIEDECVPAPLRAAAARVSSRNVRNVATLGGHVAADKSCSDLIPMLIALQARVQVSGCGRAAPATISEYRKLGNDALITCIILPAVPADRAAAGINLRASANALSTLNAAVSLTIPASGQVLDPILVLAGRAFGVCRLTEFENELKGKRLASSVELEAQLRGRMGQYLRRRPCRAPCVCPCFARGLAGSSEFSEYEAAVLLAQALTTAHGECIAQRGREQ